jgi:ribosomal protein S27AE
MVGGGKVLGYILIGIGVVLLIVGGVWLFSEEAVSAGGRVLGMLLGLLVLLPIIGVGIYLVRQGSAEETQYANVQQEKKLLNSVLTQGQVSVAELAIDLGVPSETVEDMIRSVVGKQLFSGAIDWKRGILYSVESDKLVGEQKCPNCGGDLRFAGKGLITCPYCGTDVFLTKRAAAQTEAEA